MHKDSQNYSTANGEQLQYLVCSQPVSLIVYPFPDFDIKLHLVQKFDATGNFNKKANDTMNYP